MKRIALLPLRVGLTLALLTTPTLSLGFAPVIRTWITTGPGDPPAATTASTATDLSDLPLPAQAAISAALGRDDPAYHAVAQGTGFHADNPQHALAADFTAEGVLVHTDETRWNLALSGYGYGNALSAVAAVAPQAGDNRVEYRRGALTEWYVNGPLGLEQGFTLEARPALPSPVSGEGSGVRDQPLTFALTLSGDVSASVDPGGDGLTLRRADGAAALRYRGLTAYDATGQELRASLEPAPVSFGRRGAGGEVILLRVDDARAHYPVVVDPFIEQAKLTASDGAASDLFGVSVAINGDTVVVGAHFDDVGANTNQGSAYVFVKPAGGWAGALNQSAKLTASDGAAGDRFGLGVAISGDTIVTGAFFDDIGINPNQGSTYVFVKPGGGWAGALTESAKLTASDGAASDLFGVSVAITSDTVVVGAWGDDNLRGSAYVFIKPGGGWAGVLTESAKLTASDGAVGDQFGGSVATSSDTVAVGANLDDIGANPNQGSAYVFVEPAGGWAGALTESATLTASDGAAGDGFGFPVAISDETVMVGANGDDIGANTNQGSAYVFVKPDGGWAGALTESTKLTASDGAAGDGFGASMALSGDAVVVGAPVDDIGANLNQGSAYVFAPDATPPDTTITSAIDGNGDPITDGGDTVSTSIMFAFTGVDNVGVASFECSLDGAPFSACTSPANYTGLAAGDHTFLVRAIDTSGNADPTPASLGWTVLTPEEASQNLIEEVNALVEAGTLNPGQGNALIAKLETALQKLEEDKVSAAIKLLQAFISQVISLRDEGVLSSAEAQVLTEAANNIIDRLQSGA